MCIFMMVISMTTVVEAVDTNGKVTVTNVKPGETYKIFKILTLESFDETKGAYSYIKNGNAWDGFIDSDAARNYVETNNDGYVTFKDDQKNEIGARNFGLLAMEYAKKNNIAPTKTAIASEKNVVFGSVTAGILFSRNQYRNSLQY